MSVDLLVPLVDIELHFQSGLQRSFGNADRATVDHAATEIRQASLLGLRLVDEIRRLSRIVEAMQTNEYLVGQLDGFGMGVQAGRQAVGDELLEVVMGLKQKIEEL